MPWIVPIVLVLAVYFWIGSAAIAAFFAVGSWPFLAVLAITIGCTWYLIANDDGAEAAVPLAMFCAFAYLVSKFNPVAWMRDNWQYATRCIIIYLAAALAYSLFRWLLHLHKKAGEIDKLATSFSQDYLFPKPLNEAPEEIRYAFTEYVKEQRYRPDANTKDNFYYDPADNGIKPQFSRNKYSIFRWFWWWPFSLLGWMFNDLIRELWNAIKKILQRIMDHLSALVFGKRSDYVLTTEQARAVLSRRHKKQ